MGYLTHTIIGGRVINLAGRLPQEWPTALAAMVVALLASLAVAELLHRFVEVPAIEWSRRLKRLEPPRPA